MSNQQLQKVKVKRLAHVGLWTNDALSLARFYRHTLGFDLYLYNINAESTDADGDIDDASIFLRLNSEHYSLGLFNDTRPTLPPGRKAPPRSQLHHLSFEVDTDAEMAALAARLNMSGIEVVLETRDGDPDMGDTLWCCDPDGNRVEISVAADDLLNRSSIAKQHALFQPTRVQHVALHTSHLEAMVEFYTEALGFDISDWLLRECAWLRCGNDHHTIILSEGKFGVDHVGYTIMDGTELLRWADHLGRQQTPLLWGPGRHGAGNDLFLRFADPEGMQIELSAEIQQYYDHDVTAAPRLWHTRTTALNLWGILPPWKPEE
ncbi:MAG TPA: VOC family protein [Ktedonobacteraceae bacterium]|nr:VOC family protein [Ktedonobacteraceae bacterium]